jgi:SAM-dependent methyltransferase
MPSRTWTRDHLRHAASMLRYGTNPAATVYDSLGPDFFLALDPGWLNLGLWEGDGSDTSEAPTAVRRLVRRVAEPLPRGGDVLDVGNGLGAQDPLIADAVSPRSLTTLNITLSQLLEGVDRLDEAGAVGVNGDATRLPFADGSFDGLICVEAAFHFPSRARFFAEAFRVLRPGGVLTMSDIPTLRYPHGPLEAFAALTQLRVWGLGLHAAASPGVIVRTIEAAGFADVRAESVGERVIRPALRFVRDRLDRDDAEAPRGHPLAARFMVAQVQRLWDAGILDYLLLSATRPARH